VFFLLLFLLFLTLCVPTLQLDSLWWPYTTCKSNHRRLPLASYRKWRYQSKVFLQIHWKWWYTQCIFPIGVGKRELSALRSKHAIIYLQHHTLLFFCYRT